VELQLMPAYSPVRRQDVLWTGTVVVANQPAVDHSYDVPEDPLQTGNLEVDLRTVNIIGRI